MTTPPSIPSPEELLSHMDFVRELARALVRDPEEADDLAQDAMLVLFDRPPTIQYGLRAWLKGVVIHLARHRGRTEGRRRRREREAAIPGDSGTGFEVVEQALVRAEQRQLLVHAVTALDDPYRTAIILRYFEDMKPSFIARTLDIPVSTVKSHLQRGLDKLRRALDRESGGQRESWQKKMALLVLAHPGRDEGGVFLWKSLMGNGLALHASKAAVVLIALGLIPIAILVLQSPRDLPNPLSEFWEASVPVQQNVGSPVTEKPAPERTPIDLRSRVPLIVVDQEGRDVIQARVLFSSTRGDVTDLGTLEGEETVAGDLIAEGGRLLVVHRDYAPLEFDVDPKSPTLQCVLEKRPHASFRVVDALDGSALSGAAFEIVPCWRLQIPDCGILKALVLEDGAQPPEISSDLWGESLLKVFLGDVITHRQHALGDYVSVSTGGVDGVLEVPTGEDVLWRIRREGYASHYGLGLRACSTGEGTVALEPSVPLTLVRGHRPGRVEVVVESESGHAEMYRLEPDQTQIEVRGFGEGRILISASISDSESSQCADEQRSWSTRLDLSKEQEVELFARSGRSLRIHLRGRCVDSLELSVGPTEACSAPIVGRRCRGAFEFDSLEPGSYMLALRRDAGPPLIKRLDVRDDLGPLEHDWDFRHPRSLFLDEVVQEEAGPLRICVLVDGCVHQFLEPEPQSPLSLEGIGRDFAQGVLLLSRGRVVRSVRFSAQDMRLDSRPSKGASKRLEIDFGSGRGDSMAPVLFLLSEDQYLFPIVPPSAQRLTGTVAFELPASLSLMWIPGPATVDAGKVGELQSPLRLSSEVRPRELRFRKHSRPMHPRRLVIYPRGCRLDESLTSQIAFEPPPGLIETRLAAGEYEAWVDGQRVSFSIDRHTSLIEIALDD